MRIESRELGTLEVSEEARVYLPDGLFGFENLHHFVLIDRAEHRPFAWLVSEEDPAVRFAVTDAGRFHGGSYEISLSPGDESALDLAEGDAITIFVIVTLQAGDQRVTGNLRAPVVMNTRNRLARQVIVYGSGLAIRQPMLSRRLVPLHSAVGATAARK